MRKRILAAALLCAIVFGPFSSLWVSVVRASSPSPLDLVLASTFHVVNTSLSVPGQVTTRSQILGRPLAQPTPTPTQAIPAIADPTVILTLAGVVGAFVAVVAMLFALRGKGNK